MKDHSPFPARRKHLAGKRWCAEWRPASEAFRREHKLWVLSAWLAAVFLLGGSSRADVASLMILRPISVLVLAYGLSTLTFMDVRRNGFVIGFALALTALPLLQLIPLPPDIWRALPGRGIIAQIDREAGLGAVWRPLTMAPHATWNAFWALFAPLATVVLGVQLDYRQRARLVAVILCIGFANALLGLLQIVGDPQGLLFLYHYTFHGLPVGLFANRNHQAVFLACLLPMLVVWAGNRRHKGRGRRGAWLRFSTKLSANWPVFAGAALVLPLVLIAGSRSGALLSLIALLSLPLLHLKRERRAHQHVKTSVVGSSRAGLWFLFLGLAILATITVQLGRGLAFDRLTEGNTADDMRVLVLPTVIAMFWTYLPLGAGLGSFEDVYRLHESDVLLRPFYMNHAHNDWMELALTGGIPAVLLFGIGAAAFAVRAKQTMRLGKEPPELVSLARLGLIVLLILGLASVTDYPVRTPALACLAAIAALWGWTNFSAIDGPSPQSGRDGDT